jgi:hypothetical protein
VPARHGFNRPRRRLVAPGRDTRAAGRIAFVRRVMPQPPTSIVLTGLGPAGTSPERWELQCRDGWEWRFEAPGQALVRVAALTAEQALVVNDWLQRIKSPAIWWAVSRELNSPGSAPEAGDVAEALRAYPWLGDVLPVLLEASTDGAPPPPPTSAP